MTRRPVAHFATSTKADSDHSQVRFPTVPAEACQEAGPDRPDSDDGDFETATNPSVSQLGDGAYCNIVVRRFYDTEPDVPEIENGQPATGNTRDIMRSDSVSPCFSATSVEGTSPPPSPGLVSVMTEVSESSPSDTGVTGANAWLESRLDELLPSSSSSPSRPIRDDVQISSVSIPAGSVAAINGAPAPHTPLGIRPPSVGDTTGFTPSPSNDEASRLVGTLLEALERMQEREGSQTIGLVKSFLEQQNKSHLEQLRGVIKVSEQIATLWERLLAATQSGHQMEMERVVESYERQLSDIRSIPPPRGHGGCHDYTAPSRCAPTANEYLSRMQREYPTRHKKVTSCFARPPNHSPYTFNPHTVQHSTACQFSAPISAKAPLRSESPLRTFQYGVENAVMDEYGPAGQYEDRSAPPSYDSSTVVPRTNHGGHCFDSDPWCIRPATMDASHHATASDHPGCPPYPVHPVDGPGDEVNRPYTDNSAYHQSNSQRPEGWASQPGTDRRGWTYRGTTRQSEAPKQDDEEYYTHLETLPERLTTPHPNGGRRLRRRH